MALSVSASNSYLLDNQEILRNTAKNILSKGGASAETTQKIIEKTLFNYNNQLKDVYTNPQLSVIKASTQISINNSLKKTLQYLKEQAAKKAPKEPKFGELCDYQIDKNVKNIFAAA